MKYAVVWGVSFMIALIVSAALRNRRPAPINITFVHATILLVIVVFAVVTTAITGLLES